MKNGTLKGLLGVLVVASVAATAMGHDLFPPEWAGNPRTVFAVWDNWLSFPGPMPPDMWHSNPPLPPADEPFAAAFGGATRAWDGTTWVCRIDGDGQLGFWLPNFPDENEYKLIQIQVTYADLGNPDQLPWFEFDGPFTEVLGPTHVRRHDDDYITIAHTYELRPNPEWEKIWLSATAYPMYVDQVVIDTWCVPEPATLSLLAAAALVTFARRRR